MFQEIVSLDNLQYHATPPPVGYHALVVTKWPANRRDFALIFFDNAEAITTRSECSHRLAGNILKGYV